MELRIPIKGSERYLLMLKLFSPLKPFNLLNNREQQVYSELLYINHELRALEEKKRNKLIFDYDTRREMGQKLGISTSSIYNIMSSLKKKGFIGSNTLEKKLDYANEIKIKFIDG
jgi:hypothetical protein